MLAVLINIDLFQVVKNLMISHVELRNEDSPDVTVFTHKRNVETVVVSLGTYLLSVRDRFMLVYLYSSLLILHMCYSKNIFYILQIHVFVRQ
jgi:ERCC4-related helicase